MKEKNTLNYLESAAMDFFSKGLINQFETAVVNEPSVFQPLKFYCIYNTAGTFFWGHFADVSFVVCLLVLYGLNQVMNSFHFYCHTNFLIRLK